MFPFLSIHFLPIIISDTSRCHCISRLQVL